MCMHIRIAAANSSPENKQMADVICTGKHDERIINEQIEKLIYGGTLQLLDGDYYVDGFEQPDHTAIYFGFNEGRARTINFMGDTENKGYNTRYGVTIHVTKAAMESLPQGEEGHVFFATGEKPEAPGAFYTYTFVNNVNFKNFYVYYYNAAYPVVGIDLSHMGAGEIEQVGIFTERFFEDRFLHEKPATPARGSIGIRSNIHSNDEMARIGYHVIDIGGMHTGFEFMGGDHTILRVCNAARCCYGFVFRLNSHKTLTMINCSDEGNTHLPLFKGKGQLTCIDLNIERFNADFIPDDPDGIDEPYATEETPGGWHGFISYTLQGSAFGVKHLWKKGHGMNFRTVNEYHELSSRPEYPEYLETYFDPATRRTLTWTGDEWVDAMGNIVE